jgi:hypothetical protein
MTDHSTELAPWKKKEDAGCIYKSTMTTPIASEIFYLLTESYVGNMKFHTFTLIGLLTYDSVEKLRHNE